jgi:hypothetical protein
MTHRFMSSKLDHYTTTLNFVEEDGDPSGITSSTSRDQL